MGIYHSNEKVLSWDEIKEHNLNHDESYWLVANNKIYEVKQEFISKHPGGEKAILNKINKTNKKNIDATEDFNFHSKKGKILWKEMEIGSLKD